MRRDKIVVTRSQFPGADDRAGDLYTRFEKAITPKTKVLHFCHITNLTGQLFPVQRICRMARSRGIRTIVDGAHAGAQFPVQAPRSRVRRLRGEPAQVAARAVRHGNPVRGTRQIDKFWPLQAAPATATTDIRKFEEIGTAPVATKAGIADALAFHQAIGAERKAARLYYLTMSWANAAAASCRGSRCTRVSNRGRRGAWRRSESRAWSPRRSRRSCWDKYRIVVAGLPGGKPAYQRYDYQGIRVTPNVYTTIGEIDTFIEAMQQLVKL